jgi:hypothetical protein
MSTTSRPVALSLTITRRKSSLPRCLRSSLILYLSLISFTLKEVTYESSKGESQNWYNSAAAP